MAQITFSYTIPDARLVELARLAHIVVQHDYDQAAIQPTNVAELAAMLRPVVAQTLRELAQRGAKMEARDLVTDAVNMARGIEIT